MSGPGASSPLGGFSSAARRGGPTSHVYARSAIGAFKDLLGPDGVVMELCAGTGSLSGQLLRAGLRVIAVDADAGAVAQVRRSLPTAGAVVALGAGLPFRSRRFDAVAVGNGFRSLDAETALGDVVRVLAVGGTLALLSSGIGADRQPDPAAADWARVVTESRRFTATAHRRVTSATAPAEAERSRTGPSGSDVATGAAREPWTQLWTWTLDP